MNKFGLDFGTTNSACCYCEDKKNGVFNYLKFDNQTRVFFPTIIAYRKDDDKIRYIGEMAKHYMYSSKYDVYENFKLSLGQNAKERNGRAKSPFEVTKDFLGEVIKKFQDKSGESVNNLVMTVPDIWKNEEKNKIAVDHLMEIYDDLGFGLDGQVAFESEPVSAVAYYCKQICKDSYDGYVVVVDYGGGTLDLTLCRVDEEKDGGKISVLRRCGDGGSGGTGCAGTAFDTAMTRRLIEKYGLDPEVYCEGGKQFQAFRNAFEEAKISSTEVTKSALERYYTDYDKHSGISYDDPLAFSVTGAGLAEDYDVFASDIDKVFSDVNEQPLKEVLDTMKGYCKERSIDISSQEHFRVLMVGGFSNLYCVEFKVRESFGFKDGDLRFDANMRRDARTIAVAYGAGIIAEGMKEVVYLCQSDIGFYYYDACKGEEETIALIERDHPVKEYKEPVYFRGILKFGPLGDISPLRLFFDDGKGKVPVRMDQTLRQLCPNADVPDNEYQIGFSVGKHQIPMIHVRDKSGEVRIESLHQVLEKIALQLVRQE